jgi:hypothetical protein
MADLITLEEYKYFKGLTSLENDDRLTSLVVSISQLVKTYCANSFVDYYTSDKTEYFNLDYDTSSIQVGESPLVSITSVEERSTRDGDYTALTTGEYEYYVDTDTDTVFRTSASGFAYWPQGPGSVKIVYKAGYDSIPEDLKLAVFDLIQYYDKEEYKERRSIGGSSMSNVPSSTQWRNVGFPDHIKRVLDLHKNIQV